MFVYFPGRETQKKKRKGKKETCLGGARASLFQKKEKAVDLREGRMSFRNRKRWRVVGSGKVREKKNARPQKGLLEVGYREKGKIFLWEKGPSLPEPRETIRTGR